MQGSDLKAQFEGSAMDPIILSYADSNHYLAGGLDALGNYHLITNRAGKILTFNSLREAEVQLIELGATEATLDIETAYDEMVGSVSDGHCRLKVPLHC